MTDTTELFFLQSTMTSLVRVPFLRPATLERLTLRIVKDNPGLTTRQLYDHICKAPQVIEFRKKKYPGWEPKEEEEEDMDTPIVKKQKIKYKSKKERLKAESLAAREAREAEKTKVHIAPTLS
jgi:hypothetical protein